MFYLEFSGCYMLFYQRSKGYSKWVGMDRVMKSREINPYGGLDVDQDGFKKVKAKIFLKGTRKTKLSRLHICCIQKINTINMVVR